MDDLIMELRRECLAVDLKDDPASIERYKHWHRPGGPPREVTDSLRIAGIVALDIYLIGNRLFMVIDFDSSYSAPAKAAADANDPHVQAWNALMNELQQELPFARGDAASGKWRPMEHIYSLAAQP
jgi:L-rhamnose mutarotase